MREYFLAKDTFVCETSGYAIFLDLTRDRYIALPPEAVENLHLLLSGSSALGPEHGSASENPWVSNDLAELAADLEVQGLLVRDERRGKPLVQPAFSAPLSSLRIDDSKDDETTWSDRSRFRLAQFRANVALKILPLKLTIGRIRLRKCEQVRQNATVFNEDVDRLARICSVLRPRDFSGRDTCLKDSLIMIEFLRQYDIYPDWVFGVRVHPFAAHCWVQYGSVVLNDSLHNVESFTPLMVV